jgi:transcriptional regulator NrdR family protein
MSRKQACDGQHEQASKGLCCRACGGRVLPVLETRRRPDGKIMRRRACKARGRKYVTYETALCGS